VNRWTIGSGAPTSQAIPTHCSIPEMNGALGQTPRCFMASKVQKSRRAVQKFDLAYLSCFNALRKSILNASLPSCAGWLSGCLSVGLLCKCLPGWTEHVRLRWAKLYGDFAIDCNLHIPVSRARNRLGAWNTRLLLREQQSLYFKGTCQQEYAISSLRTVKFFLKDTSFLSLAIKTRRCFLAIGQPLAFC